MLRRSVTLIGESGSQRITAYELSDLAHTSPTNCSAAWVAAYQELWFSLAGHAMNSANAQKGDLVSTQLTIE